MAYRDITWLPAPHDTGDKIPLEWVTMVSLHVAGWPAPYWFSYREAKQGQEASSPTEAALERVSDITYRSPLLGQQKPSTLYCYVTLRNVRSTFANAGGGRFPAKTPAPRIGDLFATWTPNTMDVYCTISYRGQSSNALAHTVFSGRVSRVVGISRRFVTLMITRDKRWEDQVPRHFVADGSTGAVGSTSGLPLGTHWGVWGGALDESNDPGGFTPYGDNDAGNSIPEVAADKGGYCSPVPLVALGDVQVASNVSGRDYHFNQVFANNEHNDPFDVSNAHRVYIAHGGGLSWVSSPGALQSAQVSSIGPAWSKKLRLNSNATAHTRIFPDTIKATDFATTDSFGRMVDGKAESWVEEVIGPDKYAEFYLNSAQSVGKIIENATALTLVLEYWADSSPTLGQAFDVDVTLELRWGPAIPTHVSTQTVSIDENTNGGPQYPRFSRIEYALPVASIDPSVNNFLDWDFTYNSAGQKYQAYIALRLERPSGGASVFGIRNYYLVVSYKPFQRLIDTELVIVPRPQQGKVTDEPIDHSAYLVQQRHYVEPVRNIRNNAFADSSGIRDVSLSYVDPLKSSTVFHNPAATVGYMVDSFGAGRAGIGKAPVTAWDEAAYSHVSLERVRDQLNAIHGGWRTHWLIDEETNVTTSARRLAAESLVVLEEIEKSDGTDLLGGWLPSAGGITPGIQAEDYWRGNARRLEITDLEDPHAFRLMQTPLEWVTNALRVEYAFDYVSGQYMRHTAVDHTGASGQLQGDPSDGYAATDAILCGTSFARYKQNFAKTIRLKSIYRPKEAFAIRSAWIRLWSLQHAMIQFTVLAPVVDLAMAGKVFSVHDDLGTQLGISRPDAIRETVNTVPLPGDNWNEYGTLYWRVIGHTMRPRLAPSADIVAIEGI